MAREKKHPEHENSGGGGREIHLKNLEESRRWAKDFAESLQRPGVILLNGEMGAGKTQFVRWFLEDLGVKDVASPTYAIHHEYAVEDGTVDHVDLYRVESDADLEAAGFWDLFSQDRGLVFVEWADRLPDDVWPQNWNVLRLHLKKPAETGADGEGTGRTLTVTQLRTRR